MWARVLRTGGWCTLVGVLSGIGRTAPETPKEPTLLSVFPLGGQRGTHFSAEVRGESLESAYDVWCASLEVRGAIRLVEDVKATEDKAEPKDPPSPPLQRAVIHFEIAPSARVGVHTFRLLTPRGVSTPLLLRVHQEPAAQESEGNHDLPRQAQVLPPSPIVVHGKISEKGQADYYSFQAKAGEEWRFEVDSSGAGLDPTVTLYSPSGSWFDPNRPVRLAYSDDPIWFPGLSTEPKLSYRFEQDGRYLVRVAAFLGEGGADHGYQLRVRPLADAERETLKHRTGYDPPGSDLPAWQERTFRRELRPDRIQALWLRSVEPPAPDPSASKKTDTAGESSGSETPFRGEIPVLRIDEVPGGPKDAPEQIEIPTLLLGTITEPGEVDRVTFSAKTGERLALEIETPDASLPDFNPYLRIVDETGVEAFTNVHSTLNNNGGFIMKTIQPKTVFTFARGGTFTLEVRDITTRKAGDRFRYRVLVRRQVPHMGEIHIAEEHLNLVRAEVKTLTVTTDQEEGFDGFIGLTVTGLPEGVRAMMGTKVEPTKPPPLNDGKKERFTAKNQKVTILFVTELDAPARRMPSTVRVLAQPIRHGKLGKPVEVKELLVMVVDPPQSLTHSREVKAAGER